MGSLFEQLGQFSGLFGQLQEIGLALGLNIGVAYDSDLKQVKTVIRQVLSEDECILSQPAPIVGVLELADSSINVAVRPWVNTADYVPVSLSVYEAIKTRFDEVGIVIPFPQRDLHVYGLSKEHM